MATWRSPGPGAALLRRLDLSGWRPTGARPSARDVRLAAIVAAICVPATVVAHHELVEPGTPYRVYAGVLAVAACVPAAFIRVAPPIAAATALAISLLGTVTGATMTGPIILSLALVALASSRAEAPLTDTLGVLSGIALAIIAVLSDDDVRGLAGIGGFAVGMLPALAGERLRAERQRARDARELARRVEELRDRDVEHAVAEERLRIARDVHDITGHHLSAIALQAAGAGRTTADPGARTAFERIHALTTDALEQTRRTLGVLRRPSDPAALAPLPRLEHVEHLLEPARASGIGVALAIDGDARELPEAVEMCAYRVVQESLANVMRHAGATHARVALRYGADALDVEVADDGRGGTDGPVRPGGGIEGMRERVALVGGTIAVGPREGGGWDVRATLPVEVPR
ncbi:MAG TPA: sensor histidine kinase [Capillimicrobium sp.]|nr:sensor histidine kinase [Capillimicrobium sp.]